MGRSSCVGVDKPNRKENTEIKSTKQTNGKRGNNGLRGNNEVRGDDKRGCEKSACILLNTMSDLKFIRPQSKILLGRLREPRRFIQALTGPRQVGKTTLARQVALKSGTAFHFAGADEPGLKPLESRSSGRPGDGWPLAPGGRRKKPS